MGESTGMWRCEVFAISDCLVMHVLQYPHDVDVHLLFCVDLDLHLPCSQGPV